MGFLQIDDHNTFDKFWILQDKLQQEISMSTWSVHFAIHKWRSCYSQCSTLSYLHISFLNIYFQSIEIQRQVSHNPIFAKYAKNAFHQRWNNLSGFVQGGYRKYVTGGNVRWGEETALPGVSQPPQLQVPARSLGHLAV